MFNWKDKIRFKGDKVLWYVIIGFFHRAAGVSGEGREYEFLSDEAAFPYGGMFCRDFGVTVRPL